jgi:acetylglutamate kinase
MLLKIGGKAFEGRAAFRALAKGIRNNRDVDIIIVHGGGSEISRALKEANRKTVFVDGIRITPPEDMKIVEDVLSGRVNERIASILSENGVPCKRMSGRTDRLFVVEPLTLHGKNLGYVGKIRWVNGKPVLDGLEKGLVPVISPISMDEKGHSYNVNADSAAAALAVASQCTDLVYFTDVPGVFVGGAGRSVLTLEEAKALIADGTIEGGMIAKMESAFEALTGQVERVHITQWEGEKTLQNAINRESRGGTTIQL